MIKKSVLIFGGGSKLAKALVLSLRSSFIVHTTCSDKSISNIFSHYFRVEGDYQAEMRKIIALVNPFVIVNCIAVIPGRDLNIPLSRIYETNSIFPKILQSVVRNDFHSKNIRLVHLSTDCVYSGLTGPSNESHVPMPSGDYCKSKYIGELIEGNCVTVRTSFYAFDSRGFGLLEWAFRSKRRTVEGYSNYSLSAISCYRLAHYIDVLISDFKDFKGIINIGGRPHTKYDFVKTVSDVFGLEIDVVKNTSVTANYSLDCQQFYKMINLNPPTLIDTVGELLAKKVNL